MAAAEAGVTDRTIRYWQLDQVFSSYVRHLTVREAEERREVGQAEEDEIVELDPRLRRNALSEAEALVKEGDRKAIVQFGLGAMRRLEKRT